MAHLNAFRNRWTNCRCTTEKRLILCIIQLLQRCLSCSQKLHEQTDRYMYRQCCYSALIQDEFIIDRGMEKWQKSFSCRQGNTSYPWNTVPEWTISEYRKLHAFSYNREYLFTMNSISFSITEIDLRDKDSFESYIHGKQIEVFQWF